MDYYINSPKFFFNHLAFPWDILGYGVPKAGQVHSYACKILSPHAHHYEKGFLAGNPSMREIGRLADHVDELSPGDHNPPFVTPKIYDFCDKLYKKSKKERDPLALEVLDCLSDFKFYKDWFHKRLDYLWRQGLIEIPSEYLSGAGTKSNLDEYSW